MTTTHLTDAQLSAARVGPAVDGRLLSIYLGDHLTGATGGSTRITDMARRYAKEPYGSDLATIAEEVQDELTTLRDVVVALDMSTRPAKRALARVGERLGSLKPNGRIVGTSPMTPVLELDLMRAAVNAKGAGWEVLEHYAADLALPQEPFAALKEQSQRQSETLARAHTVALATAFRR